MFKEVRCIDARIWESCELLVSHLIVSVIRGGTGLFDVIMVAKIGLTLTFIK